MSMFAKIKKTVAAVSDIWTEPEEFTKGEEFEQFVREVFFPSTHYTLMARTRKYSDNKADYDQASKHPDFKLRIANTNHEFFVEAKFRKGFFKGGIDWCKDYQLKRYKAIDKETGVLIAIGCGGTPNRPEKAYLIPVKKIPYGYTTLYPSVLKDYQVSLQQPVNPRMVQDLLSFS